MKPRRDSPIISLVLRKPTYHSLTNISMSLAKIGFMGFRRQFCRLYIGPFFVRKNGGHLPLNGKYPSSQEWGSKRPFESGRQDGLMTTTAFRIFSALNKMHQSVSSVSPGRVGNLVAVSALRAEEDYELKASATSPGSSS